MQHTAQFYKGRLAVGMAIVSIFLSGCFLTQKSADTTVNTGQALPGTNTNEMMVNDNTNMNDDAMMDDEATESGDEMMKEEDSKMNDDTSMMDDTSDTMMDDSNAHEVTFDLDGFMFGYSKTEIRVKEGDKVTINLTSTDGFHDWVIDEFNASTKQINTGQSSSVTFVASKKGTFEYYCSVGKHRQFGMKGNLIVE